MTTRRRIRSRRLAACLPLLVGACGGGADFQAFPVPPHRPIEVTDGSLALGAAVEEFMDLRGLEVDTGARLAGVTVTRWAAVAGIENGDPPIAECPPNRTGDENPEYRARYRFTVQSRAGSRSLFVEAQWETLRPTGIDDRPRWVECRSTGVFERSAQDQMLIRARMLSGV